MTVSISNANFNNLHLQVRIGERSDAESNPLVFDSNLPRYALESFEFESMLFYRRDSNPDNPDGNFTMWTQCFTSEAISNP
jgi:hypothetical protein